jgi:adenylate kinase
MPNPGVYSVDAPAGNGRSGRPKPAGQAGRCVVVTGQVGTSKASFLEEVARRLSAITGRPTRAFHIGRMMYAEEPTFTPKRILFAEALLLKAVRRSVFREILRLLRAGENVLINTHAVFRTDLALIPGLDDDLLKELKPDLFLNVVEPFPRVHLNLVKEHVIPHTLKDILVWREEETRVTEMYANAVCGPGHFFIVAMGNQRQHAPAIAGLIADPGQSSIYPSFPMTHVMGNRSLQKLINSFRAAIAKNYLVYDPGDIDEWGPIVCAQKAKAKRARSFKFPVNGEAVSFNTHEMLSIRRDVKAQMVRRDFDLILQAHGIVSFIPELPGGRPGLSSGVDRELQFAHDHTKVVGVVWRPGCDPSPFVSANADHIVRTVEEMLSLLRQPWYFNGY